MRRSGVRPPSAPPPRNSQTLPSTRKRGPIFRRPVVLCTRLRGDDKDESVIDHPVLLPRRLRLSQPMIEEGGEPGAAGGVVDRAIGEMRSPWFGVRQQHALVTARGPPAHHRVGDVGMKLQRKGSAAVAKGLYGEGIALSEQVGAERQVEAFAMPLIDLLRPGIAHRAADLGRADRVVADLGVTVGMAVDAAAEMMREHLRAEADAEKRLPLLERHGEPIDLT